VTPAQEKQLLLGALQQLDAPRAPRYLGFLAKLGLWLALAATFFGCFQFFGTPTQSIVVAFVVGVLAGSILVFLVTANVFSLHILLLCRHLDRAQIEARLRELGA
jgi:hypothetical protein